MLVGQIGDISHEIGLVDAIGNLGDDNLVVGLTTLNLGLRTHHDTATTCLVGIAHALESIDVGTSGEVGTWDELHQSVSIDIGVVDISAATVDNLTQVVSWHVRSHTDGNTVTTIHQQIRNLGRHDGGLCQRVVEVGGHINGLLVEVVHDMLTHLGETALGVTHGCRRVTVDRSEVTLTINERITHVPVLSHTDEGSID